MKVKLDENLPARLARILTQLGHQTDTIPQESLAGFRASVRLVVRRSSDGYTPCFRLNR